MADKSAQGLDEDRNTGCFLYGIVPGDVTPTEDARGLGDPPGSMRVLTHGDVAALVSEVRLDHPLGQPEDLLTYQRILDGTAAVAPVLPVRFGTVLTDPDAVVELLAAHHDEFGQALVEVDGRVEFIVRTRYAEGPLLTEILAENPDAARLRDQIRGQPEESTVDLRVQLGEMVNAAVEAKRAADTQQLIDTLAPVTVAASVRPPSHEEDGAQAAFLVEAGRQVEFEEAVDAVAGTWGERARVRLQGPLAAYDFVAAGLPGS